MSRRIVLGFAGVAAAWIVAAAGGFESRGGLPRESWGRLSRESRGRLPRESRGEPVPAPPHEPARDSRRGRLPPYAVDGPMREPRLFGDGTISTADDEFGGAFTPDGDTVYFTKSAVHSYLYVICESHWTGRAWSAPRVAPFSGQWTDSDPVFSPDGSKLFWTSDRPVNGALKHDYDIWMVERTSSGAWSAPIHFPEPVNSDSNEYFASMASNGTLYFSSSRDGGRTGAIQAYRSHPIASGWSTPENVSRLINGPDTSAYYDLDVMIAPDERFIILSSVGRPDGFGNFDLYLSFNRNGEWSRPVHPGAPINTPARDYSPHLTPDGRYLFFSSERSFALAPLGHRMTYAELEHRLRSTLNGSGNLYQIDLSVLAPVP